MMCSADPFDPAWEVQLSVTALSAIVTVQMMLLSLETGATAELRVEKRMLGFDLAWLKKLVSFGPGGMG